LTFNPRVAGSGEAVEGFFAAAAFGGIASGRHASSASRGH